MHITQEGWDVFATLGDESCGVEPRGDALVHKHIVKHIVPDDRETYRSKLRERQTVIIAPYARRY